MAPKVLIVCSSTDGQTMRICERIAQQLAEGACEATIVRIEDADVESPANYELAVVGARIRYGQTDRQVIAWCNANAGTLNAMPSAFFSVNVVARKPGKDEAQTNPYVKAFLQRVRWKPTMLDVFAGRIDYSLYGPVDRSIIRFIMWLTNGPTSRAAAVEFTDWTRVAAFARKLAALALSEPASSTPTLPPRS